MRDKVEKMNVCIWLSLAFFVPAALASFLAYTLIKGY